jgi:hypothetical protein
VYFVRRYGCLADASLLTKKFVGVFVRFSCAASHSQQAAWVHVITLELSLLFIHYDDGLSQAEGRGAAAGLIEVGSTVRVSQAGQTARLADSYLRPRGQFRLSGSNWAWKPFWHRLQSACSAGAPLSLLFRKFLLSDSFIDRAPCGSYLRLEGRFD